MPKLAVGEVNDPLEREADAIADQVMRTPDSGVRLGRACASCEADEDKLQRSVVETPLRRTQLPQVALQKRTHRSPDEGKPAPNVRMPMVRAVRMLGRFKRPSTSENHTPLKDGMLLMAGTRTRPSSQVTKGFGDVVDFVIVEAGGTFKPTSSAQES